MKTNETDKPDKPDKPDKQNKRMERIVISNIDNYDLDLHYRNRELILTKRTIGKIGTTQIIIDPKVMLSKNITGSKMRDCFVNGIQLDIRKYKKLLITLYSEIKKTSSNQFFAFMESQSIVSHYIGKMVERGYYYYRQLGISIQPQNAQTVMKGIIDVCESFGIRISLSIKMKDGNLVRYSK